MAEPNTTTAPLASAARPAPAPATPAAAAPAPARVVSDGEASQRASDKQRERMKKAAEDATKRAEEENRLPTSTAVTNPAPTDKMNPASGAFVEPEVLNIPDHPSIENNPREGTSAVQNGADFNDPHRRTPGEKDFAGQGLDMSVYGDGPAPR